MTRVVDDPELATRCAELTSEGAEYFRSSVVVAATNLIPNEPQDIVDWAAENVTLPTAVSARSGPLELNPIQAAIARLWQTTGIRQVTFLKPPRFGSTLLNVAGLTYFAAHEGHDVLFYERSDDAAQDFHDKKLFQIMEASPPLAIMMRPDTKAGIQDAWSDRILTNGASIQLRSAHGQIKSIKGLFVVVDEAGDKAFLSRGKGEGSKIDVIRRRAQEFAVPVLYVGGTPTNVGECTVSDEFSRSDKRVWRMPCPHCGESIAFEPDVRQAEDRSTPYGPGLRYLVADDVVTEAWYECECGAHIEETEKISMMERGAFVATAVGEVGHAGVYAWAAHSTDPQMTWRHVGTEHRRSLRGPEALQAYVTLVLAQAYDPSPVREIDPASLQARAEDWMLSDGSPADAPEWAEALFAGVDCQQGSLDDLTKPPRLEMTIHAVGRNRRRAIVAHHVISHREIVDRFTGEIERVPVEPFTTACADAVWEILEKDYVTESGKQLRIKRTFVDNGWRPDDAQRFCKLPRSKQLGILPIRGTTSDRNGARSPILPASLQLAKGRKSGREYLWLGTQAAKDTLGRILPIPAPGPENVVFAAGLPDAYYDGLLAEHLVELRPGVRVWQPLSSKNTGEPLDCFVYSYAAERYEMRRNARLRKVVDEIDPEAAETALVAKAETAATVVASPEPALDTALPGADVADDTAEPTETQSRFRVVQRKVRREPERNADGVSERVRRVRARKTGLGW